MYQYSCSKCGYKREGLLEHPDFSWSCPKGCDCFPKIENLGKFLSLEKCKDNFIYIIIARNSHLGIYNEKEKSFFISRFKFSENFIFEEYHWDTGEPYGTVRPLLELYEAPKFENESMLKFLNELNTKMRDKIIELNNEFYMSIDKPYMILDK